MMPGMSELPIHALPSWLTSSLVYLSAAVVGEVLDGFDRFERGMRA